MEIKFFQLDSTYKNYVGGLSHYNEVTLSGELKDEQDITNPNIIIDLSSTGTYTGDTEYVEYFKENFYSYNSAYIPLFNRYYFITKFTVIRKNIISVSLHVNVLASFNQFIRSQKAFVLRNSRLYTKLLPDERRIVLNQKEVEYTPYDYTQTSNYVNLRFQPQQVDNYHIVVNTIYKNTAEANYEDIADDVVNMELSGLPNIDMSYFIQPTQKPHVIDGKGLGALLWYCMNDDTLASYVGGMYAYPFNILDIGGDSLHYGLYVKDQEIRQSWVNPMWPDKNQPVFYYDIDELSKELIVADFVIQLPNDADFNRLEPYSIYEIYIPYYGYKQIPFNQLIGKRILVFYIVNFTNGTATAYLYNVTDDVVIFSAPVQLGVEIPKSITNAIEVKDRSDANRLNLTLTLVGSMLSIGGGLATGNMLAVAGGGLSATKNIGQYYMNEKTNYDRAQLTNSSSGTALASNQIPHIKRTTSLVKYALDNDFLQYNGGVCNRLLSLGIINGYTEIGEIEYKYDMDIPIQPTETELNEITNLLKSGVYFS